MPRANVFLDHALDRLAFVPGLRARAMFGGYGLYQDEVIFAIIVDDTLYLKANDASRGDFEAAGLGPFRYTARGKTMTMQYYEAPAEAFEDAEVLRRWTGKALDAALAARTGKTKGTRGKA